MTKATAARQRRQRSVSTADNGALYEDNGIGLYRRKKMAAAEIDNDSISGSISLICGSKQQSTDDRGEETVTTIQRPMGDGKGEIQQSALILDGGGWWSGLDRVLSLGGEGLSRREGGVFAGGGGIRELIVTKIHRPKCENGVLRDNGKHDIYSHAVTSGARRGALFRFSRPILRQFSHLFVSDQFWRTAGAFSKTTIFSDFKLACACPLCPPCLHHASTAHAPRPRPTPAAPEFDRLKSLYYDKDPAPSRVEKKESISGWSSAQEPMASLIV
jgi:hypothetical protein